MIAGLGSPQRSAAHTPAASLIAALSSSAEDIRRDELSRAGACWDSLCPADRLRLEVLTRRIVGALLAAPIERLRETPAEDAEYLGRARYLFGLESWD